MAQALDRVRHVVVDERAVEHELAGPLRRLRTLDLRVVGGPVEEDDRVWVDIAVQRVGVFVEAFVGCGVGLGVWFVWTYVQRKMGVRVRVSGASGQRRVF